MENPQEILERMVREKDAHITALTEALQKTTRESVQAKAQLEVVKQSAALRLNQAIELIDTLYLRIEFMLDEWKLQVETKFQGTEEEIKKTVKDLEPFRPLRMGKTVLRAGVGIEGSLKPEQPQGTQKGSNESDTEKPL